MQAYRGVAGATTTGLAVLAGDQEACAARVPPSVRTAAARANRGVHAGTVAFATSTSASRNPPKSCRPCTMRTGALAARRCGVPDDDVLAHREILGRPG